MSTTRVLSNGKECTTYVLSNGIEFTVINRYKVIKFIGRGAYGTVVLALDLHKNNMKVAIKRLDSPYDSISDAIRNLREIKLMQIMNHRNILKILDMFSTD